MLHIPEILKIIEGGLNSNATQVTTFAKRLADKLEKDGEALIAQGIRSKLKATSHQSSSLIAPSNMSPAIPVDRDSRLTLGDESRPTLEEFKIQLPTDLEDTVDEFINFIEHSHQLTAAGVGIAPSMLIFGPPGCGKTQLASHIAASLDLPLITARCDTLISSYLGATSKNMRSLFDHASSRPCVLFLDEFDAFAKARDDQHEVGELKRVVVSLLQNIDNLPDNTILIAATNHEELLDRAVWRRFAYRLQVPLPSKDTRELLLAQFLGSYQPKIGKALVDVTEGMNGAIIEQACKVAIRNAVLSDKKLIDNDQLIVKLIQSQYHHIFSSSETNENKIISLRLENKKIFTISRLSMLFGLSTGKISDITSKKRSS